MRSRCADLRTRASVQCGCVTSKPTPPARCRHTGPGVLAATEEDGVLASRADERELVKGHDLTASSGHAGTRVLGDAQASDAELGHVEQTHVIGDGTDDDADVVLTAAHVAGDAVKTHRRAVRLVHRIACG